MRLALYILIALATSVSAGTVGLYQDVSSWTGHVYLAIIGDSLSAGGGCGGGVGTFPAALTNAGARFSITNASISGAKWLDNSSTPNSLDQMNAIIPKYPRFVMMHFGRNDVAYPNNYPNYWDSAVSNCVYAAWTNCTRINAILILSEIFPAWTNFTELKIPATHGFNSAYATFAASHSNVVMSLDHDAVGRWNPNSGGYDYLSMLYACSSLGLNDDEVHIIPSAYTSPWSPIVLNAMAGFFPDPPPVGMEQLHVDQLNVR